MGHSSIRVGQVCFGNPNSRILDYDISKKEKFFGPDEYICSISVRGGQSVFGFGKSENEAVAGALEDWELEFFEDNSDENGQVTDDSDQSGNAESENIGFENYLSTATVISELVSLGTDFDHELTEGGDFVAYINRRNLKLFTFVCKTLKENNKYCWAGRFIKEFEVIRELGEDFANMRNRQIEWGRLIFEDGRLRLEMDVLLKNSKIYIVNDAALIFLTLYTQELKEVLKV